LQGYTRRKYPPLPAESHRYCLIHGNGVWGELRPFADSDRLGNNARRFQRKKLSA
jgi:hypothetical protein